MTNPWIIANFDLIAPVACPCGEARRAFYETDLFPGTIHRTTIRNEAKTHYHKQLTETYYILECDSNAALELDGELIPVRPGMCVIILSCPASSNRRIDSAHYRSSQIRPEDEFVVADE